MNVVEALMQLKRPSPGVRFLLGSPEVRAEALQLCLKEGSHWMKTLYEVQGAPLGEFTTRFEMHAFITSKAPFHVVADFTHWDVNMVDNFFRWLGWVHFVSEEWKRLNLRILVLGPCLPWYVEDAKRLAEGITVEM